MLPSIFGENLFEELFEEPFRMMSAFDARNPLYGRHAKNIMKTDVRETENTYELDIDLPGFKKEDVQVQLENGTLTIAAAKSLDKNEQDEKGRYLRQELYTGQCSRSFYVGDQVKAEDLSAKFEDGILRISMPKAPQRQLPQKNLIAIE